MEKTKIILDCDPGHDDAVAITLAANSDKIDLLGITVVAGNQTLEKTQINARNVCQWLGVDVPVYAGCGQPMVREKMIAGDIHGETGLDGPVFPPLTKELEKEHAVDFIVKTLMESDGDITMVTTGPMTNLAMAMRMEPAIIPKIKQIVLMGGAYTNGNVTPAAEFNIIADADAAYVCFTSGRPITMMGLDVTRFLLLQFLADVCFVLIQSIEIRYFACELIVQLRKLVSLNFFDGYNELSRFASQLICMVLSRESNVYVTGLAFFLAD